MENKSRSNGELREAFRELGDNLRALLQAGWESQQRRQAQREIEQGLNELAETLKGAAEEFAEGDAGQRLKEDLEALQQQVRSEAWEDKARQELLRVLTAINEELDRKRRDWSGGEVPDEAES